MTHVFELETTIKQMIDEMKGLIVTVGLTGSPKEIVLITSAFLYKFLNDRFVVNLRQFSKEIGQPAQDIIADADLMDAFYDEYSQDVEFKYEDTIDYLVRFTTQDKFYKKFDDALVRISEYERNQRFSIENNEGEREPLFTRLCENVDAGYRDSFAKNLFKIFIKDRFDFSEAFTGSFDFYSQIFEYLIKDYNVASGTYAEYFTPQAVSAIIAKILVHMSPVEDRVYDIYDPSAGSGSLVLHLANELGHGSFGKKANVYTQDISEKSTQFLRINLMLNGLTSSLKNVIKGDTLMRPAHYNIPHEASSGIKHFDFITSNPPFRIDFSATRNDIERRWQETDRFFAGVPKIPDKKKKSMAIYLCFIQHILWSLKEGGKAAIVVPTGFLTNQQGKIEKAIRQRLIDQHWLKGVISMPPNIFANTGTNVSVLFIDKANTEGKVILVDAARLGEKRDDGGNQRTVLSESEIAKIEDTFIHQEEIEDFSILVTADQIKERNYSFAAGQYFPVKIEYVDISEEEFNHKIATYQEQLKSCFIKGKELEDEIRKALKDLKYEN